MQFVARDGRAFGDVTERDLDVELRERLLHEPRVSHEFLLGLGRLDGHIRVLEKIHRRQLVIADDGRLGHGELLRFFRRTRFAHGTVGDVNGRLGRFVRNSFRLGHGRFGFGLNWLFRFGLFAENFFGGGGGNFARSGFFVFSGGGWSQLFGRFGEGGFAVARAFGLRHGQIAHGRFGHGLHIRAETGAGDLPLQLFGLLLEFAGAAVELASSIASGPMVTDFSPAKKPRIQPPSRKLVRKNRLMKPSAA